MGWADCGYDSKGRPIGYAFEAICDEPGCNKEIDRRLSYACGGMHGQNDHDCEKYFCSKHLYLMFIDKEEILLLCSSCAIELDEWKEEEEPEKC